MPCIHPYKMKSVARILAILKTATFSDRIVRKHFLMSCFGCYDPRRNKYSDFFTTNNTPQDIAGVEDIVFSIFLPGIANECKNYYICNV